MEINVKVSWDDEAGVWLAINEEIGLFLESGSFDALVERVRIIVPELMEADSADVTEVCIKAERHLVYA